MQTRHLRSNRARGLGPKPFRKLMSEKPVGSRCPRFNGPWANIMGKEGKPWGVPDDRSTEFRGPYRPEKGPPF